LNDPSDTQMHDNWDKTIMGFLTTRHMIQAASK
jgi:hypothetical protein